MALIILLDSPWRPGFQCVSPDPELLLKELKPTFVLQSAEWCTLSGSQMHIPLRDMLLSRPFSFKRFMRWLKCSDP